MISSVEDIEKLEKSERQASGEEIPSDNQSENNAASVDKFLIIAKDPSLTPDGIGFQVQGMDMDEALILLMHGSAKFEREYERWVREKH